MYNKNLTEDLRLRLSKTDMDFLKSLSTKRGQSVSEVIRSIVGEYRRNLETIEIMKKAIEIANKQKEEELSHGDTKTDFNNLV